MLGHSLSLLLKLVKNENFISVMLNRTQSPTHTIHHLVSAFIAHEILDMQSADRRAMSVEKARRTREAARHSWKMAPCNVSQRQTTCQVCR